MELDSGTANLRFYYVTACSDELCVRVPLKIVQHSNSCLIPASVPKTPSCLERQVKNFLFNAVPAAEVHPVCVAGARHPPALLLGHDLCVRSLWQLRGLWWAWQHLLHLQLENSWRECPCQPWARWAHRWVLLLRVSTVKMKTKIL